jgi:hypothetical protein
VNLTQCEEYFKVSNLLGKLLLAWPAVFLASVFGATAAVATEATAVNGLSETPAANQSQAVPTRPQLFAQQIPALKNAPSVSQLESDPLLGQPTPPAPVSKSMAQVTSVSQLSDVQPSDWAFQALQSLVEKYGCIAGYPDGTFRGNRAATRYELAAALNACLDVISDRFATKEDLAAVRQLMVEFAAELATIKGRVDNLEARTSTLEAIQFSTTTKLRGVAVFSFSDALTGPNVNNNPNNFQDIENNVIATYRVRLNLDTSFTGKDLLRTRLQAGNVPSYASVTGTNMSRLAYDVPGVPGNSANLVSLDKLYYRFPIFGKGTLQADALRLEFNDNMYNFNPLFESGDRGAVSRFGRYNPIYRLGQGAGLTFNYPLWIKGKDTIVTFTASYAGGLDAAAGASCNLAADAACATAGTPQNPFGNPGGSGLFGGPYAALVQFDIKPVKNFRFGVTYVRAFGQDVSGGTGSRLASNPFGTSTLTSFRNTESDNFGFQFTYKVIPKLTISGWTGYSSVNGVQGTVDNSNASVINWGLTLGAPDLWRKGDLAGLIVGTPPTVFASNGANRNDSTLPFLVEAQYRFGINENISVTPAVIAIFNPLNSVGVAGEPTVLGVIRTTFTF